MTEVITMDQIMNFLWEAAGFRPDQAHADGLRVLLEAKAANLAKAYGDAPRELVDAHLDAVAGLARQLLDTGVRFLDEPKAPLVTAADLVPLRERLDDIRLALGTQSAPALDDVARKEDVAGLSAAVWGMRENVSVQSDLLQDRILARLDPSALRAQMDALTSSLLDRVDRAERRLTVKLDARQPGGAVTADLSPVQSQLDTLTKLLLVRGGAVDVAERLNTLVEDVAELCEQVTRLQATADRLQQREYRMVPSDDARPASQMTSAGGSDELPDWERDLLEGRIGAGPADPVIAEVLESLHQEEMAVAAEKALEAVAAEKALEAVAEIREEHGPWNGRQPGCFFNDDGTITCRVCEEPKDPSEFYGDKRAQTGKKSACKRCEYNRKAGTASAA